MPRKPKLPKPRCTAGTLCPTNAPATLLVNARGASLPYCYSCGPTVAKALCGLDINATTEPVEQLHEPDNRHIVVHQSTLVPTHSCFVCFRPAPLDVNVEAPGACARITMWTCVHCLDDVCAVLRIKYRDIRIGNPPLPEWFNELTRAGQP